MALAPVTGVFGLVGFSGRRQREEELFELLRGPSPHYGADWWFLGALVFAACECGPLDEAWDRRAQRDLVAHTMVAAYLRAGRADDARQMIARRIERRPAVNVAGFRAH